MDAFTDPRNKSIVIMKSARVGYTQMLNNAVGYFIHHDPSPMLMVQPTNSDAEDHSKRTLAPMLRDVPCLSEIVGNPKSKDSSQTILVKQFKNSSSIKLVGADSPSGFRRITVRVVLFDEIDGYAVGGAGSEGDQIALGKKRADTFWNRVIVLGSTPTVAGVSRIEKAWEDSDKRYFFLACPHCGEQQKLEWGGPDTPYGIKWRKDHNGDFIENSAHYLCVNGCEIEESHKAAMLEQGEWIATAPFRGHAGYHIWAAYSLLPNAGWSELVKEWRLVHKDPLQRQTFINLVLGLPYVDHGDKALAEQKLLDRRESWADEVPDGVGILTAGIDFQSDRCEIEVVGWGRDEESWSVAHHIIEGDIEDPAFWQSIDDYLLRRFRRADGRPFVIQAACLDSGGQEGHTQKVYQFCKARLARKVWAIKGEAARKGQRSPIWPTKKPSSRNKQSFRPVIIGVNTAKDSVRHRLHIENHGPGYMHFPQDRDIGYFQQLIAERLMTKEDRGQKYKVWELPAGRANEALDCRVYAYAALCGLNHFGLKLNQTTDYVHKSEFESMPVPTAIDGQVAPSEAPAQNTVAKRKRAASRLAAMNN